MRISLGEMYFFTNSKADFGQTLIEISYFEEKFNVILILDKKTTSKKAKRKIADFQAKQIASVQDFVGKVKKYGEGLAYQKNIRNELL